MPMNDDIPRPVFNRAAAHGQFSLVANVDFQFWQPHEDRGNNTSQHWWYQSEEPAVPLGWSAPHDWWLTSRSNPTAPKCRIIYHPGEERRLR